MRAPSTCDPLPYQLDMEFWANPDRFFSLADKARVSVDDIPMLVETFAMMHLTECPYVNGGKYFNGEEVALDIFVNNYNERTAVRVLQRTIEKLLQAAATESPDEIIQKLDADYQARIALIDARSATTGRTRRKRRTK